MTNSSPLFDEITKATASTENQFTTDLKAIKNLTNKETYSQFVSLGLNLFMPMTLEIIRIHQ